MTNKTVRLDVAPLQVLQFPERTMSSFTVGNYVEVARRMQPGANEEGGGAKNYRSL